jgi:hypothetical protein
MIFEIDKSLVLKKFDWEKFIDEAKRTLPRTVISQPTLTRLELEGPIEEVEIFSKVLKVKHFQSPYTHFFSLPIIFPNSFLYEDFKRLASSMIRDSNLEKMFMPKAKLHLTVCMLILDDEYKRNTAATLVRRIVKRPFEINFSGIDFIGEDVRRVRVVYAKPDPSPILDEISRFLLQESQNVGICDSFATLWHCTLINTRYRKSLLIVDMQKRDF